MKKNISNLKKNKLMNMFIYSMLKLPTPVNLNMWWNFGSMLGLFLIIQIISGLFLSMHYCPNMDYAYESIIHIMKDVNLGWLIRLIHMNGASFYFMLLYIHISRGLYYNSYLNYKVWLIGILILLLSMMTAFLGYVLPWGQMSYWGAMVITNLLSAFPIIGESLVYWIWGGFSVNNATLNRFFSLHFIIPLIIMLMVILHLYYLHMTGSNNSLGLNSKYYMIPFHPYYSLKDLFNMILLMIIFFMLLLNYPYVLGDPDNFKPAEFMVTPAHIKPEWYFLFAYSILRSIPNKFGGVIMLLMSIMILFFMPMFNNFYYMKNTNFYPINKMYYWLFINSFILLTWLGGQEIEYPYIYLNYLFTFLYFSYYLMNPLLNNFWDKLIY